jgi:hypothetical protein
MIYENEYFSEETLKDAVFHRGAIPLGEKTYNFNNIRINAGSMGISFSSETETQPNFGQYDINNRPLLSNYLQGLGQETVNEIGGQLQSLGIDITQARVNNFAIETPGFSLGIDDRISTDLNAPEKTSSLRLNLDTSLGAIDFKFNSHDSLLADFHDNKNSLGKNNFASFELAISKKNGKGFCVPQAHDKEEQTRKCDLRKVNKATQKMKVGPSESAFRSWLQTTSSCCRKERWW